VGSAPTLLRSNPDEETQEFRAASSAPPVKSLKHKYLISTCSQSGNDYISGSPACTGVSSIRFKKTKSSKYSGN
jgi:hypothetical protein